ncbi:MAG TPA: hypothetical protein VF837_02315, partial [Patescibacteria group bacterium]
MAYLNQSTITTKRLRTIILVIPILTLGLIIRLFYWQIIRGPELQTKANRQYETTTYLKAKRGDILDSEGNVLAGTKNLYNLFVYKPQLEISSLDLINKISAYVTPDKESTNEGDLKSYLLGRLSLDSNWVSLLHYVTPDEKKAIESL